MVKEKDRLLRFGLRMFDLFFAVPSFYLAYHLHVGIITPVFSAFFTGLYPIDLYRWILHLTIPLSFLIFHLSGLYKPFRVEPPRTPFGRVLKAIMGLTSAEYLLIYVLLKHYYVSRFFIFLFMVLYLTLLIGFRFLTAAGLHRVRERGFNYRRVLIIGTDKTAREVFEEIESHRSWGLKLLGFVGAGDHRVDVPAGKVIGELKDLESILKREVIDEVFVALSTKEAGDREDIFRVCEKVGVNTYLVPAHYEWQLAKSTAMTLGRLNLIRFFTVPINPYLLGVKRGIDLLVSASVLCFFPLLYLLIGGWIKLDSPGPVLYRQVRVAHNRRRFYCYKFRTMVKEADRSIHLLERVDETEGPIRKSKQDPRVTRVGKLLRKWSLDEIPQFINILKGEMSLVGPRPPTPDEVERYEFHQLRRLSVKQGLTGLWQVSGRDEIKTFEERLRLDLYYIDHWSLWLDLKIILKTIVTMFKGAV